MSFRAELGRRVTIIPRSYGGEDDHGNPAFVEGTPITDVPCRRDQHKAHENETEGELETLRFVYFFLPSVAIDAYSRILDGDDLLEVFGDPSVEHGRGNRRHHLEVLAEKAIG